MEKWNKLLGFNTSPVNSRAIISPGTSTSSTSTSPRKKLTMDSLIAVLRERNEQYDKLANKVNELSKEIDRLEKTYEVHEILIEHYEHEIQELKNEISKHKKSAHSV